jgi:H+-translocating NAD(P) transhydrogenase subunit alpha
MKLAVPRELRRGERRAALVPESVKKLVKAGIEVAVERGAGAASFFPDEAYREAGATLEGDVRILLADADLVLKVNAPEPHAALGVHEVDLLRPGSLLLTTLLPVRHLDAVRRLAERHITAFSTDALPRSTRAQAMDTLSSMASIAGYRAVLLAANELPRYFPMFMTAAGTVLPAKVFVIGAGVAGLQAIATARRLGAVVEATDTRPAAKGDIESLGAKYVGVDTDEAAQDAGGYAKELSADFYQKQAELIARHCAQADVVITTALIGGVKAPRLITAAMVDRMKPGSVLVDLAAPGGGNCELTRPGEVAERNGVRLFGPLNPPSELAIHGSLLYSRNLAAFVLAFWKDGAFQLDLADELLKACTITHDGQVLHGPTAQALQEAQP